MSFWRCKSEGIDLKDALTRYTNEEAAEIFNPSWAHTNELDFFCYRCHDQAKDTLDSILLIISGDEIKRINLSQGVNHKVADPKFFWKQDSLWITYNTGYSKNQNELYVQQVHPDLGKPKLVKYNGRTNLEKNWGFFAFQDTLLAVYSLNPLIILKLDQQTENDWVMLPYYEAPVDKSLGKLSIGTQPYLHQDNYYLIAHRKIRFGPKRLYYGMPIRIYNNNTEWRLELFPKKLIHSYKALLGSSQKLNKNLISCTYFSGLTIEDNQARLSYGINDQDFGITACPLETLWK
jgi:hypothetical protein